MVKKAVCITMVVGLLFGALVSLSADSHTFFADFDSAGFPYGEYGEWKLENGRLYQKDQDSRLAKITFEVDQSGIMEYSFNVRYEGGALSDRMGGFGLQVFVDDAHKGKSWGNGESYLLWVNYDQNPSYGQAGFRAQVYRSYTHSRMELLEGYDIPLDQRVLQAENLKVNIPVKIQVNGSNGLVKVWDPTRPGTYIRFYLDEAPGRGNYFSLRSNSLAVSFDNLSVKPAAQ